MCAMSAKTVGVARCREGASCRGVVTTLSRTLFTSHGPDRPAVVADRDRGRPLLTRLSKWAMKRIALSRGARRRRALPPCGPSSCSDPVAAGMLVAAERGPVAALPSLTRAPGRPRLPLCRPLRCSGGQIAEPAREGRRACRSWCCCSALERRHQGRADARGARRARARSRAREACASSPRWRRQRVDGAARRACVRGSRRPARGRANPRPRAAQRPRTRRVAEARVDVTKRTSSARSCTRPSAAVRSLRINGELGEFVMPSPSASSDAA